MKILGVDNGLDGGLAFISGNSGTLYRMPVVRTTRTKRIYDELEILRIIEIEKPDFAIIEKAQVMRKQGITSSGKIMYNFGFIVGLLTGKCPIRIIEPKKWQKQFSISGDTKNKSYLTACRLFPEISEKFRTERGRILDGLTDAILIAEYERMQRK